ncbi:S-adenosyl-L-methionine-dependent methyltransferase, partial [Jimgerdemannia flammicorona]
GLGIGISTSSLQRHNITVDIVEIDPAIYTFARDYFNLTPTAPHEGGATHRAFIQDGRQYIRNAAERVVQMERAAGGGGDNNGDQEQSKEGKKRVASATAPLLYDYVLHDVFTGGSLPVQLFTVEALKDIRKVLKKDGVLALNFAGSEHKAIREPLDIIASTIATVFSHVKCFREPPTSSSESAEAFDNMVRMLPFHSANHIQKTKTICRTSRHVFFASVKPLAFRRTIEGDYLGSAMRRHLLPRLTMYPVRLNLPKADISVPPKIVSDKENPLAELQMPLAVEHWRVMREVFPVGFWVNY